MKSYAPAKRSDPGPSASKRTIPDSGPPSVLMSVTKMKSSLAAMPPYVTFATVLHPGCVRSVVAPVNRFTTVSTGSSKVPPKM